MAGYGGTGRVLTRSRYNRSARDQGSASAVWAFVTSAFNAASRRRCTTKAETRAVVKMSRARVPRRTFRINRQARFARPTT